MVDSEYGRATAIGVQAHLRLPERENPPVIQPVIISSPPADHGSVETSDGRLVRSSRLA